eukprot:CAMPEP_0114559416 /NCGR_PEP_ID=MMETSP0114-20121206/10909_1 /TAXON_ID=31324 /ORGANISM="Goniomonas sp, Strain m" /LENGTH=150 /DNA_ID=CAMNT_0001744883 /DNA_START=483 /DNA_END=935 /DNA_ORIENTATION=-
MAIPDRPVPKGRRAHRVPLWMDQQGRDSRVFGKGIAIMLLVLWGFLWASTAPKDSLETLNVIGFCKVVKHAAKLGISVTACAPALLQGHGHRAHTKQSAASAQYLSELERVLIKLVARLLVQEARVLLGGFVGHPASSALDACRCQGHRS